MKNPIQCPECDSRNIALITEYHKSIFGRLLQWLSILITALLVFTNRNNKTAYITIAVIGIIIFLLIQAYVSYVESKTHVQCICKDCGWIWIHNFLY